MKGRSYVLFAGKTARNLDKEVGEVNKKIQLGAGVVGRHGKKGTKESQGRGKLGSDGKKEVGSGKKALACGRERLRSP